MGRIQKGCFLIGLWLMLMLTGCQGAHSQIEEPWCNVVLEEGEGYVTATPVQAIVPGQDVTFTLTMDPGSEIQEVDYLNYTLENGLQENQQILTLHQVGYPVVVSLRVEKSDYVINYHANGGTSLENPSQTEISVYNTKNHLRINTSIGTDLFVREGYTLIGWNTSSDGSGSFVGLGSRVAWQEGLTLYAQWRKCQEEDAFTWELAGDYAVITGYTSDPESLAQEENKNAWNMAGQGDVTSLVIPETLGGHPVISIGEGACANLVADVVVFPKSLQRMEDGSFNGASIKEIFLYDNLVSVTDYAFSNCENLQTLHINAIEAPVYSGTYFDTFSDKFDRLCTLANAKKIVLFSGSSTRFGYDSPAIDAAFSDYEVVNMGVFAYTNAYPQLLLILSQMQAGDVLLDTPEFDAAKRQFCSTTDLDESTFAMMESNYDNFAMLDLRQCTKVFSSFYTYVTTKASMTPRGYSLSPSQFDEDGNSVSQPSYNEYGDYVVERPNNTTEEPIYGLEVEYTVNAFPKNHYIDTINAMYERFLEKGISVYFSYSPRNRLALSKDSTLEERARLHQYFCENLVVPVISQIEDSLVSGIYLYGTDNHLSTQGVEIRTKQVISELKEAMGLGGGTNE